MEAACVVESCVVEKIATLVEQRDSEYTFLKYYYEYNKNKCSRKCVMYRQMIYFQNVLEKNANLYIF